MPKIGLVTKWLALISLYITLIAQTSGAILCLFVPLVFIALVSFSQDQARDKNLNFKSFAGKNLFFQIGTDVKNSTLIIPCKNSKNTLDVNNFILELHQRICDELNKHFASLGVISTPAEIIVDTKKNEKRAFSKIIYRTSRGSIVSHFLHFATTGEEIVAHYSSYTRGTYEWFNVLDFIITSPVSIWGWYPRWLNSQYSILASLSTSFENSYDKIDVRTFYVSSYTVILNITKSILQEKGILSEELQQTIVNYITNAPQINITNSPGTILDKVANVFQDNTK